MYKKLMINHGFLLGLAEKGFMTVMELQSPQKEKLTTVTTNINLPEGSLKVIGNFGNKRLIITYFKKCVVLVDTIEGPLSSIKLKQNNPVCSVVSVKETGLVLSLTADGRLNMIKLNESII
ncbi:MAG: hypothetical protein KDD45_08610 [Bdellovibrionales bacterium]|nr:hypothetical protein [Bdellovibrionales bacterium]